MATATIRACTTIEQSRKLAEILPLESADNEIVSFGDRYGIKTVVMLKETLDVIRTPFADIREITMCWSLAALLGVIKKYGLIDLRFLSSTFDNRGNHLTNVWCCTFEDIGTVTLDLYAGNPIDACVAMIEKLHELKML